eukprot:3614963-Pyramimonas_sp.AAC.1
MPGGLLPVVGGPRRARARLRPTAAVPRGLRQVEVGASAGAPHARPAQVSRERDGPRPGTHHHAPGCRRRRCDRGARPGFPCGV